jgi:hypothetical protein
MNTGIPPQIRREIDPWPFIIIGLYLPVVIIPYAFHDDNFFWLYNKRDFFSYPQFTPVVQAGRPLAALVLAIAGQFIEKTVDLSILRAFSVLGLILIYKAAKCYLCKLYPHSEDMNSVFSILLVTLPGFSAMAAYSANFYYSYAVLFVILSANQILESFRLKTFMIASALILASLMLYPPAAFFYVALMFPVFAIGGEKIYNKLYKSSVFVLPFVFSVFIYMGIMWSIINIYYQSKLTPDQFSVLFGHTHSFAFSDSMFKKMAWFISNLLPRSLSLWNMYDDASYKYIYTSLICITLINCILGVRNNLEDWKKNSWSFVQEFFFHVFLIFACATPVIIASGGHNAHRLVMASSAVVVLFLHGNIQNFEKIVKHCVAVLLICFAFFFTTFGTVFGIAINNFLEYRIVLSALKPVNSANYCIKIFSPHRGYSLVGFQNILPDEFFVSSLAYWPADTYGTIRRVLVDTGRSEYQSVCIVTDHPDDKSVCPAEFPVIELNLKSFK